jgi:Secretion system C-terminal sorting domain/SprB repeat/PKD-like domain
MNKKSLRLFFFFTLITTFLSAQISVPEVCSSGFTEPAEDCWSACVNCNLVPFLGSTSGFAPSGAPYCPGYVINNDQWIGFIAGASSITFTVVPNNCTLGDGVQVAIYTDDCFDAPIACNGGCIGCGTIPQSVTANLIPGNVYYLLIDGFGGDECDFEVVFTPLNAAQAPTIGITPSVLGPSNIQPGETAIYAIPSVTNASFYTWNSTPGVLFNGLEGPVSFDAPAGRSVEVTFPAGFIGQVPICVRPGNTCSIGTEKCKIVNVAPNPPTILPKVVVCNEDIPYVLPWGDNAYTSGTYSIVLTSYLGADSLVSQMVQVLPKIMTNTTKYICEGDTLNVCGTQYFKQGFFSKVCTSYRGCDSLVNLTLNVLAPKAKILSNGIIGCEQTNIVLKSLFSPNFPGISIKRWTRPDGSTKNGDTLLVSTTGIYKLCTTMGAGSRICSVCDSILVIRDSLAIPIVATSGLVDCETDSLKIVTTGVQVAQPIYQWSGPNNFSSTLAEPVVYHIGNYTVTVTTPAGCSGTGIAVVTQGAGQPSVTATSTGGSINCTGISPIALSATTTAPNATFLWLGPNNFSSDLPNTTASVAGTYTVIVTDTLGCSDTANVIFVANNIPPVINSTSVQTLDCGNSFLLSATATGSGLTYTWKGPGGVTYMGASVNVIVKGSYTLVVTNTTNACSTSATVVVASPPLPIIVSNIVYPPTAGENNGAIDIALNYQTDVMVNWYTNGNLLATTEDLFNLSPGTYDVVVTTNTGCTTTQSYTLIATSPTVFCTPSQNVLAFETCGAGNCVNCDLHNYTGSTSGWLGDPAPPGWCSQVQNDQWLAFVAGASNATITVTPSNCTTGDGIQFAVYPYACGSTSVACSEGCAGCGNTPISLNVNLIPGQTYYLVIDGFSQDECDFVVTSSPSTALSGLPMGNIPAINGDSVTCPNSNSMYSINTVLGADQYTWSSPTPGILFNGQPSPATFTAPLGTAVQVSFPANSNGAITICTQSANACNTSAQQCTSVNIAPIVQVLPTETICASALPFNLPWGATATSSGIYSSILQAVNGCDSTVQQEIVVLDPIADILGNNMIGCGMNSIELQSAPSAGSSKVWSNLITGQQLGAGNNLSISQAGTYVLVVQNAANGKICAATDTVTVVTDSTTIVVMASGGVVGCTSDSLALTSSVAISNIQYAWTGPGGFQSNLPSPIVTEAGDYTLLVSNAQGCSGTATASVVTSDGPPPIVVSATLITCAAPLAQLSASSTFNNVNYAWEGPLGFQSNLQNPETVIGGNYTVTVSDPFGCTNTATQTVDLDTAAPLVNITPSSSPCVGVDMLTANTTAGTAPTFLWSGPGGVISNSATIEVDTAGLYTVIVTNTTNGCTTLQTQNAIHGNFTPQVTLDQLVNPFNGLSNGSISITVSGGLAPYSYTWSTGGLVASTSEDAIFLAPGDYICYITGADSCTTTVTYTLVNTVATQDIADQNQWALQPNPSTGIFYLTNKNGAQSPSALHVFDVLGRSIWSTPSTMQAKEMAIDLTQMPDGVYWLEIEQAAKYGGRTYKKLVLAR